MRLFERLEPRYLCAVDTVWDAAIPSEVGHALESGGDGTFYLSAETPNGDTVIRYDSGGNTVWSTHIAASIHRIEIEPDGVYVIGRDFNSDPMLIKFDHDGTHQWTQQIAIGEISNGYATTTGGIIKLDDPNTLIEAGDFGSMVVGDDGIYIAGTQGTNGFISKLGFDGSLVWRYEVEASFFANISELQLGDNALFFKVQSSGTWGTVTIGDVTYGSGEPHGIIGAISLEGEYQWHQWVGGHYINKVDLVDGVLFASTANDATSMIRGYSQTGEYLYSIDRPGWHLTQAFNADSDGFSALFAKDDLLCYEYVADPTPSPPIPPNPLPPPATSPPADFGQAEARYQALQAEVFRFEAMSYFYWTEQSEKMKKNRVAP